jgi:tRNA (cmo5U34)-methyltransferase
MVSANYRWNATDNAAGYDASAQAVHPFYLEIQTQVLACLPAECPLLVDLGGGSGRLVERFLERWPTGKAVVVDQSEAFLELAARRLARFGNRGTCIQSRLQDAWDAKLPGPASAVVSMSAIHHLEPAEKAALYGRCGALLSAGGMFVNGDEVRPADEASYRRELETWAAHMRRGIEDGSVDPRVHGALRSWIERNVTRFGDPKRSGDDCHETLDMQLEYLRAAGFSDVKCVWQQALWAVLYSRK